MSSVTESGGAGEGALSNGDSAVASTSGAAKMPELYTDAFPALSGGGGQPGGVPVPVPAAVRRTQGGKAPVAASGNAKTRTANSCTEMLHIPLVERKYKHMNEFGGEAANQQRVCQDIKKQHGVHLETSLSRDQSLTVIITGTDAAVKKARRDAISRLQTHASHTLTIPKAHHGHILGKSGHKLQELELTTATKISLPRSGDASDAITITGNKEGIMRAARAIQAVSDEQAKLAFERMELPRIYQPFVSGAHGRTVKRLQEETGARIVLLQEKEEVTVSGEKDGVKVACDVIRKIRDEKERLCRTISVEVTKKQHKYVIGPKGSSIQDVMDKFEVSVEVPPADSPSNKITLRGEQDRLGPALTQVYSNANSVMSTTVTAPTWLHKHIIGRKGEELQKAIGDRPQVHVNFPKGEDLISLEGPPEDVAQVQRALEEVVATLTAKMAYEDVVVPKKYHRNIIGKNGARRQALMESTGTQLRIPVEADPSEVIRVEGDPKGVLQAKAQLLEMARKMDNERTRDILIDQRFHRAIIGPNGSNIRDIRRRFNQVQITLPGAEAKSEVVVLKGPKEDVEKCYKYLEHVHKDMIAKNYQESVHIFKEFHKNVIGKSGASIRKIREETNTKIDLPGEASQSDEILITGKKEDVLRAIQRIEDIQREFANLKEETLTIPHKLHNSMIGAKGRLIRAIMEECGGVLIKFPQEGSASDRVTVRGPKDDVDKACKQLMELSMDKEKTSYVEEVTAKPEYHKFLIGKGGVNIRKVRDTTGARVMFPSEKDTDSADVITIMGEESAVLKAKEVLLKQISDLAHITEQTVEVDTRWHRHFVARRGEVLTKLAGDFGGVSVSFPRSGVDSRVVTVKGGKDCVQAAVQRVLEIVADLESMITKECVISQSHHRTVMGMRGTNVQRITKDFNVQIKFPERPAAQGKGAKESSPPDTKESSPPATTEEEEASAPKETTLVNGGSGEESGPTAAEEAAPAPSSAPEEDEGSSREGSPAPADIILVTGKPEDVDGAIEALQDLVPISVEMDVPFAMHRFIIGQGGQDLRAMVSECDVNISMPPPARQSDTVVISGAPANVARARAALQDKMKGIEKDMEDKVLRSFEVEIRVDAKHHPKIIGRRGASITKLREDHGGVNVQFPARGAPAEDQDKIVVVGYEERARAAADAIMDSVRKLESLFTLEVAIDSRVHNRIIGAKGKIVRGIMNEYDVDVRFPRSSDPDPNMVVITGEEYQCYDCKDHLLDLEDRYMDEVIDREAMRRYQTPGSSQGSRDQSDHGRPREYTVAHAPWDTTSTDDFPTIGATAAPPSAAAAPQRGASGPAWGPRR